MKLYSNLLFSIVFLALAMVGNPANAQNNDVSAAQSAEFWPNADYDPMVPTIKSVLGYEIGERISTHGDIIKYFEALEAALPKRVKIKDYATTWEGRRLIYAIIGTEEQIANLNVISANSLALSDPRRTNAAQANAIIANQPAIVWLANSVHGDEISPADSSMMTAYHLLASRGDARMGQVRQNTLTIIVPMQNPDGRERFLATNRHAQGAEADADEFSAERDQPWPGGRMNHYNFDLNRDWISLTQPETQGHTKAYLDWFPQVMVDAHEMGREGGFFFPPEADPINPNHTLAQRQMRAIIGTNNARWFDNFGITYFTREVFDGFYPGYGDGWPTAHGTIAMTYEQGSARGLVARGRNGAILTYRDTVRNHFVAALSTIEVAGRERQRILRDFYDFRKTAIAEGQNGNIKSYIIPAQSDQASADKLAALMVRQGIDVKRASASFSACGANYGVGSYIIATNQPSLRLIRNLLDKDVPLEPAFVAAQLNRRERGLEDEIYDVTAWSMPLMYNIDVKTCNILPTINVDVVGRELLRAGSSANSANNFGFIIKSGTASHTRFTAKALRAGIKLRSMEEGFTHNGIAYPAGSLVVLKSENSENYSQTLGEIARFTGANAIGIENSWVESGPSFGSIKAVQLRLPRIAMAWDNPTDPYSAGNLRYTIEQKIGLNVTPLRTSRLRSAPISRFDVLILPDTSAGYLSTLGDDGVNNLRAFAQNGGTIIAIGSAVRFLATPNVDLLATRRESALKPDEAGRANAQTNETVQTGTLIENKSNLTRNIIAEAQEPTHIDGAILQVETTEPHWLTVGLKPNLYTMYQGSDIFRPLGRNNGVNALVYSGMNEVVASGLVWENNRKQLAYKPFAMVQPRGRGFVIGITADIAYRAHIDGLDALIANALLQSSARTVPNR